MALSEEIKRKIQGARPLSGPGGPLELSQTLQRKMIIFDNGIAFIENNDQTRWSGEVNTAKTNARQAGFPIVEEILVEPRDILDIDQIGTKAELPKREKKNKVFEVKRQELLHGLLNEAASQRASDIHIRELQNTTEVRIRVFGRVKDLKFLDASEGKPLMQAIMTIAQDTKGGSSSSLNDFQQGALTASSGVIPEGVAMVRLQYSPAANSRGAMIMRLAYESNSDDMEIDGLGYNAQQIHDIKIMRTRTNGMYILAGKVSSGKSTTLQRVLNKMFVDKQREILTYTIEEPVELALPGAIQIPVQKNGDRDGFVDAMKSSMRSDPNIIVMGETRSAETSALAIQAVMTGHALWTTVHAGTALGILDRLIDLGVEPWKLADPKSVRGLVYQRLSGVMCKHCRIDLKTAVERKKVDADYAARMTSLFKCEPTDLYVRGPGCQHCKMGLGGRTVVAETVLTDPRLLEYFSKGDRIGMQEYWLKPVKEGGLGGVPVLHHALSKVGAGLCDIDEVEEEVDLLETYEHQFMHLQERLLQDVKILKAGR